MEFWYSVFDILEEGGFATADVALDCEVGGGGFADLAEHEG